MPTDGPGFRAMVKRKKSLALQRGNNVVPGLPRLSTAAVPAFVPATVQSRRYPGRSSGRSF
jgi:hypothetical protein